MEEAMLTFIGLSSGAAGILVALTATISLPITFMVPTTITKAGTINLQQNSKPCNTSKSV